MTDEVLEVANNLKRKIDKLNEEIYLIMDIEPSVRSNFKSGSFRGKLQKIINKRIVVRPHLNESCQIELSNEDCRALIDIRTAEKEALEQVLREIQ